MLNTSAVENRERTDCPEQLLKTPRTKWQTLARQSLCNLLCNRRTMTSPHHLNPWLKRVLVSIRYSFILWSSWPFFLFGSLLAKSEGNVLYHQNQNNYDLVSDRHKWLHTPLIDRKQITSSTLRNKLGVFLSQKAISHPKSDCQNQSSESFDLGSLVLSQAVLYITDSSVISSEVTAAHQNSRLHYVSFSLRLSPACITSPDGRYPTTRQPFWFIPNLILPINSF